MCISNVASTGWTTQHGMANPNNSYVSGNGNSPIAGFPIGDIMALPVTATTLFANVLITLTELPDGGPKIADPLGGKDGNNFIA